MPQASFADFVTEWDLLLAAANANAENLPQLAALRDELLSTVQQAKTLDARQASLRADFSQATRDLEATMARGKDLATRLRAGVRSQYGTKGEKLAEFGMRPRRKRPKKQEPEEPPPAPSTPPPAQTTAPPALPIPPPAQPAGPATS